MLKLLVFSGLLVARLLVASDQRLKELFTHHGGTKLLMGMASYSQGFLRSEVASTLKTITRSENFFEECIYYITRRSSHGLIILTGFDLTFTHTYTCIHRHTYLTHTPHTGSGLCTAGQINRLSNFSFIILQNVLFCACRSMCC